MEILLDLDCVLVDWVGPACRRWGLEWTEVEPHWPKGVYDLVPPLGRALQFAHRAGKPLPDHARAVLTTGNGMLTADQFWAELNGDAAWWATLPSQSWAEELLTLVRGLASSWRIVSAPGACESSKVGKERWLRDRFGLGFTAYALTPHKEQFARPGTLLIDDHALNVERFVAAGGDALLFPAHHNRLHPHKADPLRHLREMLGLPRW